MKKQQDNKPCDIYITDFRINHTEIEHCRMSQRLYKYSIFG